MRYCATSVVGTDPEQAQSAGTLLSMWGFRSSCRELHSEGQAVSFSQPVVSSAEVNVELSGSHKSVNRVTVVSAVCQRANKYFAYWGFFGLQC